MHNDGEAYEARKNTWRNKPRKRARTVMNLWAEFLKTDKIIMTKKLSDYLLKKHMRKAVSLVREMRMVIERQSEH